MAKQSCYLTYIKYILLTLSLSTQLFAYEYNKPITIYGYVSEQVIDSSVTKKKENYYISNTYHIDGKGVKSIPLLLLFDNNKTNLTIPIDHLNKQYKLKGIIVKGRYKYQGYTLDVFKVSSIEKRHGKIKVASYLNNYSKVKLWIKSPMVGKEEAKLRKTDVNYISNIKVKADNELLYNVNISPCLSESPLMKFSYKDINPLSLTLDYTDNNGIVRKNSRKVKHKNSIQDIPKVLKLSENPKSYSNKIKSIQELYGNITLIEDGIQITAPKLAENGGSVPINIRSNIKFKSIALFVKSGNGEPYSDYESTYVRCGEKNKYNLVSQWFSTPHSIVDFSLRVTMKLGEGEALVVLEAENGKFYTVKKYIDVSVAGLNAGG